MNAKFCKIIAFYTVAQIMDPETLRYYASCIFFILPLRKLWNICLLIVRCLLRYMMYVHVSYHNNVMSINSTHHHTNKYQLASFLFRFVFVICQRKRLLVVWKRKRNIIFSAILLESVKYLNRYD